MAWWNQQRNIPKWWPFVAIVAVATLFRLAVLYAASVLPYFTHHRLDALVYHRAGIAIASGDWSLGSGVLHMSPGYSYFVGILYSLFGPATWPLRLIQLMLGVFTVVLIYAAAKTMLKRPWAMCAALIAALYGPFAFYETHILAATTAAFSHALLLWLALRAVNQTNVLPWIWTGLVWGLAALIRPTALLFGAPLLLAWWLSTRRQSWRHRIIVALALGGAAVLVIAPITLRNYIKGGEFVLVTDSGGLNFYLGNGPGAIGTFRVPANLRGATNANAQFTAFAAEAERAMNQELTSKQVNAYWYSQSWQHIRRHPGKWLRLLVEKAWLFWNGREPPNTHDYEFNRIINPVLGLPCVQFAWLSPLALFGLICLIRQRRKETLILAGFIAMQFCAMVLFFVLAHYRIPAIPSLILAAVFGAYTLLRAIRDKNKHMLTWATPLVLAGIVVTVWPKLPKPFDDEYFKLGYAYHVQNHYAAAGDAYQKAIAINPNNISAHKNLAQLFERIGDIASAQAQWRIVGNLGQKLKRPRYTRDAETNLAKWGLSLDIDSPR